MGSNLKILGGEFAGEVIELGSKVSNLSKGDKVMCRGGSGWAEFALAHHLRCVKFQNEQINWEKASSIQGSLQTKHDAIITNGKFKKQVLSMIPMGRLGEISDLMGPFVFLASDASSLMTGSSVLVDGGWTSR